MFGFRFFVSCSVLLAICYQHASALTDEERAKIFGDILPHLTECSKEFSVTPDQVKSDGKAGKFDSCLVKCILKRVKLINDKGLFDADKAAELAKGKFSSADDMKTIDEIITKCASVNDQAVGDGEEGCERSQLLLECAKPFKSQFFPAL